MRMIKILAAAIALAIATAPGTAMAKQPRKAVKVAAVLGTANLFVARFIGNPPMNTVPASVVTSAGGVAVHLPGCTLPLPPGLAAAVERAHPEAVVIGVRPEHLEIDAGGVVPATVTVIVSVTGSCATSSANNANV